MRRAFLCMTALLAISARAFSQAASSDTQTLQALLSEVRALRQDLRVSLNRTQGSQILLARLQLQEGAVTRASDHLNDARQKLFETHVHQRELSSELKRTEEALNTGNNPRTTRRICRIGSSTLSRTSKSQGTWRSNSRRQKSKPSSSYGTSRTN